MAIHDEYIEIIIRVTINSNSNRSKVEVKRAMARGQLFQCTQIVA